MLPKKILFLIVYFSFSSILTSNFLASNLRKYSGIPNAKSLNENIISNPYYGYKEITPNPIFPDSPKSIYPDSEYIFDTSLSNK